MEEIKNQVNPFADSKIFIKLNEKDEEKDFSLVVPKNCSYAVAKQAIVSMFEYLIKIEMEAQRAQEVKNNDVAGTPITPEVV